MSPIQYPPLPIDTARAAELVFGREHPYLKIGESLGIIWEDLHISDFAPADAFLLNSFYPYSFVTILQYWEYLTDRQMAQATRMRLDMKYALHLPINFPGIEPSTLCEFRQHVLADRGAHTAIQGIVQSMSNFAERGNSSTSVEQLMTAICLPSRAEIVLECMGVALEAVASTDPNWLKIYALPHWYRRYYQKFHHEKIPRNPREIDLLIQSVGNDGWHLMEMIEKSNATGILRLPEIKLLRDQWQRQFILEEGLLKFRKSHCLACSSQLKSIKPISMRKEEAGADNKKANSLRDRKGHGLGI